MNNDATAHSRNEKISPEHVERERTSLIRHSRLRLVHWVSIILSLVLTLAVWQYSRVQIALRTDARFDFSAAQVTDLIQERLQKYELALWAGVSTLGAHEHDGGFSNEQWRAFASTLEIEHRYEGINGIGVIYQIQPQDLDGYLAAQRLQRPDFKIFPPHNRDIYQPITFIEPVNTNKEAVGLDVAHEENRHIGLNKARDTNSAQITGPIILVQDKAKTPGFLFYAPYYQKGPYDTLENRRENFTGAVYAPFIVSNLMHGLLDRTRRSAAIRITDDGSAIYDEIDSQDPDYDENTLQTKRLSLELYGRKWDIDFRAGKEFHTANSGFESTVILIAGILIDFALLALFTFLTRANRRALIFTDMATNALAEESNARLETNKMLDITLARAERSNETKSVFLSTISHEVRTPLTAIGGILVLLARADLPEKQMKLVQAGKRASENLIKLLTDVLDSSRLEANAVEIWQREIAIKPLLEEWQTLAMGMVGKLDKEIVVISDISKDTPETIYADDIRLSQVLNNLMDNAVRFTEQGTITIRTYSEDLSPEGFGSIVIAVQDTGIGIAESDLALIFERFRQVDGTFTRARGGAGLGLAICHDLIELMGGDLKVTSELGSGIIFEVRLPIQTIKESDA